STVTASAHELPGALGRVGRPDPDLHHAGPQGKRMVSAPSPGRYGRPPPGLHYQLGLLARVNVYAVPPTTLLIFILSSDHSTRNLARLLLVTTVVANCNFLFL